jgi:CubicO group peptidase (beta-lactamase class C family)
MSSADMKVPLTDPERLFESINRTLSSGRYRSAGVGLIWGDRIFCGGAADRNIASRMIRLGCITKLLTFSLLLEAVHEGLWKMEDALDVMVGGVPSKFIPSGIVVRHAFNHAHGLDDSTIQQAPVRRDGFIDVDKLCQSLGAPSKIAVPGRFYSYGSGGALLAAAILEREYGSKYYDLLANRILIPLGISAGREGGAENPNCGRSVCPATGGKLALSMKDLLMFLQFQMLNRYGAFEDFANETFAKELMPLPGWHSIEKAICFGWKYYGQGWFGHNSEVPGAAGFLRVNPRLKVGIVVASDDQPPTAIASALFRSQWPNLVQLEMPKMGRDVCLGTQRASRHLGTYANCGLSYTVTSDSAGRLFLKCRRAKHTSEGADTSILHPADAEIFFLRPPVPGLSPFIQFVCSEVGGFGYLWNGSQMLPRI